MLNYSVAELRFIITSVNITIRYLSKTFLILNLLFNENKSESQGLLPAF